MSEDTKESRAKLYTLERDLKLTREVAGNVGGNNMFSVGKGLIDCMKISIHS